LGTFKAKIFERQIILKVFGKKKIKVPKQGSQKLVILHTSKHKKTIVISHKSDAADKNDFVYRN